MVLRDEYFLGPFADFGTTEDAPPLEEGESFVLRLIEDLPLRTNVSVFMDPCSIAEPELLLRVLSRVDTEYGVPVQSKADILSLPAWILFSE